VKLRRSGWLAASLLTLPLSAVGGCASPVLVEEAGGLRHTRHGYWIDAPPSAMPRWERVEVKGAEIAYRRDGPVWMTLSSRCEIPLTRPRILARHLRIGIPAHTLREETAVRSHGMRGWQQVFDASEDGVIVRVKTVTLVLGGCALDAMLSARDGAGYDAAQPGFDAWWRSLRPLDPPPEPPGTPT
jgi:hypothetical protein